MILVNIQLLDVIRKKVCPMNLHADKTFRVFENFCRRFACEMMMEKLYTIVFGQWRRNSEDFLSKYEMYQKYFN